MVLLCRQLCRSCPSVLTVNLSNLNHLNHKDFIAHSRLTEIFFLKLLPIQTGEMITDVSAIQLKLDAMDAFCLSAERNRTNRVD